MSKGKVYNRIELDYMAVDGCAHPNCDHKDHTGQIFITGRCHVGAAVTVSYTRGSGILEIRCKVCKAIVGNVAVA
jgi:hypothetical protein